MIFYDFSGGMVFFKSAPAQNARSPVPVMIPMRIFASSRISHRCVRISNIASGSSAFSASGRFSVMVAILPSFLNSTDMVFSLGLSGFKKDTAREVVVDVGWRH